MDLVLIRLVDMTFSRVFSDPHLGIGYMVYRWIWFECDWWTSVSAGYSQLLTVYIQGLLVDYLFVCLFVFVRESRECGDNIVTH